MAEDRLRVDHYFHIGSGEEVTSTFNMVMQKLDLILAKQEQVMGTMEELNAAVTRNTDAGDAVVTLLQGISQQLKDAQASNDPDAIDAVIAKLDQETQRFSDAVTANTPAAASGGS